MSCCRIEQGVSSGTCTIEHDTVAWELGEGKEPSSRAREYESILPERHHGGTEM